MNIKNRYMLFGGWNYEGYDFIGFYDSLDGLIVKINDSAYSGYSVNGGSSHYDYVNVVDLMNSGAVRGESGNDDMKWVDYSALLNEG